MVDVVENSNEQVDDKDVGTEQVQGHCYRCHPPVRNEWVSEWMTNDYIHGWMNEWPIESTIENERN